MNKRKKPLRKCVVTNEMFPKEELIRVVRNKEGEVFVDETGKKNGRGAYIKKDREVIEKAMKNGQLQRSLNTAIDETIYDELFKQVGSKHV
ncbi:RNase P modulator RnpM [Allobacillus sp. GCM10007491]|uniref:YlxR family protein n=2 Tax=Allobacillus TaxID=1400133 RepID=A0A941CTH8_9BACI|nr:MULTISPECIES: YlxR family protein [Allobacillus]MBR7552929.1 YlxR family protein [Allobacillus saliphilus]TSJ67190.1 YlxR family protein [Allobacillus salarius]